MDNLAEGNTKMGPMVSATTTHPTLSTLPAAANSSESDQSLGDLNSPADKIISFNFVLKKVDVEVLTGINSEVSMLSICRWYIFIEPLVITSFV